MSVTKEKFRTYVEQQDETRDSPTLGSKYYLELFDEYYKQNKDMKLFIKWNLVAGLLGPIWMAYRGMFWAAAILFILTEGLTYLTAPFYLMGIIALWILSGLYGNSIYFMHVIYWIKEDNQVKRGVDKMMGCIMLILFAFQFITTVFMS